MTKRALILATLPEEMLELFFKQGIEVDCKPELSNNQEALAAIITDYDALVVSCTEKITEKLLSDTGRLCVIGCTSSNIENIDITAASAKGIAVISELSGNARAIAEYTLAMMLALARHIPAANLLTRQELSKQVPLVGVGLEEKTLGIIGVGDVGSAVCRLSAGFGMRILAHDPSLPEADAKTLGVEKVSLEFLIRNADFLTLHVPLNDTTLNILSAEALAQTKAGVRIINCATERLIDENALADALKSGHVAGAALDILTQRPISKNPLANLENVILTPQLAADTLETQRRSAAQTVQQVSNFLQIGAAQNTLNTPSLTSKQAVQMPPWIKLAEHLGSFVGQMTDEPLQAIHILFDGIVTEMNLDLLEAHITAKCLQTKAPHVNIISAPTIMQKQGIQLSRIIQDKSGVFAGYIKITIASKLRTRSIAGTVFSDQKPRFIQIKGINIDAEIGKHMLYTTNQDKPGIIGVLGSIMQENGVNIANFTLGRAEAGGEAIALLYLDTLPPKAALEALGKSSVFKTIRPLFFDL